MQSRIEMAAAGNAPVRGDWQSLLDQVGVAPSLETLDSLVRWLDAEPPADIGGVRYLVTAYRDEQLLPCELPFIRDAFRHATRGETRELIALDASTDSGVWLKPLLSASHRAGRDQLRRLRPLRDFRVAQRYLSAVENGEAQGWHTLAYGVTLAAYAVPLRQGMLHYAHVTLRRFTEQAARPLNLTEAQLSVLVGELCLPVGATVDALIGAIIDPRPDGSV